MTAASRPTAVPSQEGNVRSLNDLIPVFHGDSVRVPTSTGLRKVLKMVTRRGLAEIIGAGNVRLPHRDRRSWGLAAAREVA